MLINIRGTNGSGKTTLARAFQRPNADKVVLAYYDAENGTEKTVTGVRSFVERLGTVCCVGSYHQAQGGMDTIPNFQLQQDAIRHALNIADHVICEGILASTVAGSWVDFFKELKAKGEHVLVMYLDTPLDTCFARIAERQERAGKVRPIKTEQVKAKFKSIAATREKFNKAGILTGSLRHEHAEADLLEAISR